MYLLSENLNDECAVLPLPFKPKGVDLSAGFIADDLAGLGMYFIRHICNPSHHELEIF